MAFTVTARHSANSGTVSAQTVTTGSATPTANSLLLTFYGVENDGHSTSATLAGPVGGSLTYTLLDRIGHATNIAWAAAAGDFRLALAGYYAPVGGSPAAHTIACDAYTGTQVGLYSAAAVDVTGHNTATPIVQTKANGATINPASNTATGTVTLTSTPTAGNLVVVAFMAGADAGGAFTAPTMGAGKTMTQHHSQNNAGYTHIGVWSRVCDGTESTTITCTDLGESVGNYTAVAVELAAASGGSSSINATPADAVAATDAPSSVRAVVRATDDAVAATDAATPQATRPRAASDPVAASDTVTAAWDRAATISDSLAVTDPATDTNDATRAVTDSVAVTDVATADRAGAGAASLTDPVAVGDALTVAWTRAATLTDSAAISDTLAGAFDHVATVADFLAATDTPTKGQASDSGSNVTDPAPVTDNAASSTTRSRALDDTAAITDALDVAWGRVAVLADTVPATDAATVQRTGLNDGQPVPRGVLQLTIPATTTGLTIPATALALTGSGSSLTLTVPDTSLELT